MGTQIDADPPDGCGGRARRWRWSRVLWVAVGFAMLASLVVVVAWGDQVGCHFNVAREGHSVPDLTGYTLEEARGLVRPCIEIESNVVSRSATSTRIVEQVPQPPAVLNSGRAVIQVTLGAGS